LSEANPFLSRASICRCLPRLETPEDHRNGWSLTIQNRQSKIEIVHMYPAGNLFIPAPHGQLEAILKEPRSDDVRGVALVLHPHPLGGGTMHNKVVFRARPL
jgi:hypothetical protein